MSAASEPHGVSAYSHDFPPGTEQVDAGGKELTVHYPSPTDDPTDPLNWSQRTKVITFGTGILYTFVSTVPILGFSGIYPVIMTEYSMSAAQISESTGWNTFILAIAGFVVVPACSMFGRRPTLFFSNLINIAALIWLALSRDHTSFFWSRNLSAVGTAMIEYLAITQVGDLFFTFEGGFYHSLGLAPLVIASSVGSPIAAGFEQSGAGWRAFIWLFVGLSCVVQVVIFFYFPESVWTRNSDSARGIATAAAGEPNGSDDEEKGAATTEVAPAKQEEVIALVGHGKPSRQQRYNILQPRKPHYSPLAHLWKLIVVTSFAPTLIADLWWMAIGGTLVGFGLVASSIWSAPPYNFSIGQVGCTNLPAILGGLLGFAIVGPISDWDLARRTRNNNNVRESEFRLWVSIYGGILSIIALVIYAVGIQREWHWAVVLICGQTFFSIVCVMPSIGAINYATDTLKTFPLEISLSMTLAKNLWTFGIGYFINDLYASKGALVCVMIISTPFFLALPLTVGLLFVGKPLRRVAGRNKLMQ